MNPAFLRSCVIVLLAAGLTALQAADTPPPSPPAAQEQYDKLNGEVEAEQTKFYQALSEAKTDLERNKAFNTLYPKPEKYTGRFLALARDYPGSPAAVDALIWVATQSRGDTAAQSEALATLGRDHLQSDKLGRVCPALVYSGEPAADSFLRTVLEKSPHRQVQAMACLSLAQSLHERDTPAAEKLYERAATEFGDVSLYQDHTIRSSAEGALFEIRQLAVGKPAPEIVGKDADGKEIKLSDYRGKVVVVDFWGRW